MRDNRSTLIFSSAVQNFLDANSHRDLRSRISRYNVRLLKRMGYAIGALAIAATQTACSSTSIPLTQKDRDSIKTIYVSKLIVRDARPAILRLDSFKGPVAYGGISEWHTLQRHDRFDSIGIGHKKKNKTQPGGLEIDNHKKHLPHDNRFRGDLVRYYDGNLPSPGYYEIYNNEKIYNKKLSEQFSSDEIRIDQVLYKSFVNEWEKRGLFPLTPSMEPDAIIKLELINYGLLIGNVDRPSAVSTAKYVDKGYAPYMMVRAYIVDSNDKIIWQEEAEYELFLVGAQNRLRLQQWISRPKELQSAFEEVSATLSEAIVAVLAKKFKNSKVSKLD
ncbi:MAG: hypothetical protein ACC707_05410 [Thiohalomonadales bacterium]